MYDTLSIASFRRQLHVFHVQLITWRNFGELIYLQSVENFMLLVVILRKTENQFGDIFSRNIFIGSWIYGQLLYNAGDKSR